MCVSSIFFSANMCMLASLVFNIVCTSLSVSLFHSLGSFSLPLSRMLLVFSFAISKFQKHIAIVNSHSFNIMSSISVRCGRFFYPPMFCWLFQPALISDCMCKKVQIKCVLLEWSVCVCVRTNGMKKNDYSIHVCNVFAFQFRMAMFCSTIIVIFNLWLLSHI